MSHQEFRTSIQACQSCAQQGEESDDEECRYCAEECLKTAKIEA